MSQVDLFDHFTAKPMTYTWIIEDFEKCPNERSFNKTSFYNQYMFNIMRQHAHEGIDYFDQFVIQFTSTEKQITSTIYYRISLVNDRGLKCNTQEGRASFGKWNSTNYDVQYRIKRDYLLEKANGLLPGGKLTICFDIFDLWDKNQCAQSGCYKDNLVSLSHDNQSLLDSGKLSDVVLAVGERELKAHKLILSSRSVVLEKMFEVNLEESKRNRVEITDMSAGAAEDLLKFIYTGKVGDLEENAYELYAAAHKYQIDSLKSYCELYLTMSLSISSVATTLQLAELYSLEDLKSKCINYITHHSAEFELDDWKELIACRPELMSARL